MYQIFRMIKDRVLKLHKVMYLLCKKEAQLMKQLKAVCINKLQRDFDDRNPFKVLESYERLNTDERCGIKRQCEIDELSGLILSTRLFMKRKSFKFCVFY